MRILAIETATGAVGCALWADGGPLASFVLVPPTPRRGAHAGH